MKEDNIGQLGDYDAPFCEQQYTHGSCYTSLFKFKSFDQFNTPQLTSNFRHLLSCGTIEVQLEKKFQKLAFKVSAPVTVSLSGLQISSFIFFISHTKY